MRLTKKESPVKIKAFKVSRVKFNILHLGVGTNLALQIIEPKRKTDNGHRVISRGLKLVTKQWMNQHEGWHDKHYFGALKCFFFFIKRTNKRLSAKTLDTLVTLESAVRLLNRCVACALADILGKE